MAAPYTFSSSSAPKTRKRTREEAIPYDVLLEQAHKRMRQQADDQALDPINNPAPISPVSAEHVSATLYYADRGEQLMTAAIERASAAIAIGLSPTNFVPDLVYENYRDILVAMQWFPKQYEDKFTIFLTYLLPNQVCAMYKIAQNLVSKEAAAIMVAQRRGDLTEARLSTVPLMLPPTVKSIVIDFDGTVGTWMSEGEPCVASLQPMWPPSPLLDARGRMTYFLIRPGWEEFANAMGEMGVEMYAMTSAARTTADAVRAILQWKRKKQLFKEMYVMDQYREEMTVKDLRQIFPTEDKLRNALLIDDNAADICVPQACAFPVTTWRADPTDKQLAQVLRFFRVNLKAARNMQELCTLWRKQHPELYVRKT